MKLGFWDYVREAFKYRPGGMWFPPNYVGIAAFVVAGIVGKDPLGWWLMGSGAELAYLYFMASSKRFQRSIRSEKMAELSKQWEQKLDTLLAQLDRDEQRRYHTLAGRCQSIIEQQSRNAEGSAAVDAQGEGLSRLLQIYLRLLFTRKTMQKTFTESAEGDAGPSLNERVQSIDKQIKDTTLGDELRKSLTGQLEILNQRLNKQKEAREKMVFLEAELTRIQEQVELLREQAALTTDPDVVSHRIDEITSTLGNTTQWITDQQQMLGKVEDLMSEAPPLTIAPQRPMVRERA
jgi:hypothetical protein